MCIEDIDISICVRFSEAVSHEGEVRIVLHYVGAETPIGLRFASEVADRFDARSILKLWISYYKEVAGASFVKLVVY